MADEERDPMRAVGAHDFLMLIAELVRTAVTRSEDHVHCYAALRSAARAFELSLPDEALKEAREWHDRVMGDLAEETLSGFALEAIRDQGTTAVPPETVDALVSGATTALNAVACGPNYFDVLVILHMAKLMVLAVLVHKTPEEEMGELLLRYTSIKRSLSRIDFGVAHVAPVGAFVKGGQA
jgi:hypothetical protein